MQATDKQDVPTTLQASPAYVGVSALGSFVNVMDGSRMFIAGGTAGAIARTATAPLDRIKMLFQVQVVILRCSMLQAGALISRSRQVMQSSYQTSHAREAVASSGTSATAYTGLGQAFTKIFSEEGFLAFWKGNGANIIRIFPYSAAQLAANDQYKRLLSNEAGQLSVGARLAAGAAAGMTATALTHPLDTLRLRMALPNSGYTGIASAMATIGAKEGVLALYKGLVPTLIGIAPYAALNFASYDLMKHWAYSGERAQSPAQNLLLGAAAGTIASSVCYPLDTIRRRMQMRGHVYNSQLDAFATIWKTEGFVGFYRGWTANALKVVPQNSIRFVGYEFLKTLMGIHKAKTDT